MTAQEPRSGKHCPECHKTHEECADGGTKLCSRSNISFDVCCTFGTRRPWTRYPEKGAAS